jgi:hypothetical protein
MPRDPPEEFLDRFVMLHFHVAKQYSVLVRRSKKNAGGSFQQAVEHERALFRC